MSNSEWSIGVMYVKDHESNTNKIQNCIKFFDYKPDISTIKEFIISTDFGNNDILNSTDYSKAINIIIMNVFVYPFFKDMIVFFQNGLPEKEFISRVSIYNEVLVGLTSTQMQQ
jgi:hypothetical protein